MAEWGTFSDGSTVEEIQILDLSKEAGVTTALSLEGEADFFKFTLDTTAGVGSKLSLTGIDASELSFCVYDSEGSLMGFSVDGSAGVSLANLTAGDYYVKVTGTEDASYSISHTITAPPAVSVDRADNFVVLFSGGYNPRSNRPYYYYNIKEIYTLLTEEYEIDPACIYILYADGDSQEPDNSGNTNSDMSFAGSSTVLSATDENLRNVFREISVSADSNDHFLFYSFDHGAESLEGTDYLCGWGEMIEDSDFAEYVSWISAGYQTYIMSQCYSGGMLEDITVEGNIFVAGSSAGDKVSHTVVDNETGRAAEGFSVSVEEALKQGITDTHALYQYIYKENPYSETDGSYMAGGDFAIFGSGEVVPDENGNNGGDTAPVTGGLKVYDSPVYKELTEAAAGSTVAVAAKALALEADAEITEVAFYLKDKNGRTKLLYTDKYASDGWQFLWQISENQAAGEYVISARAKDSEGRYSTASEMEFLVREKNYHPEIISIDLEYEAYRAGSEITVCGVAQDKDSNGIDSVRIYLDMDGDGAFLYPEEYLGITGVDSEGKWSFTFTVDAKSAVGSYRIMAEAIDALDMLAGQSRSVGFQVTEYKVSGFEVKGSQLQWLNLDAGNCILEFSADNFKNAIIIETWNNLVDLYNFTGSDYEVRAAYSNNVWNEPVSVNNIEGGEAARFVAECNGGLDLFFVRSSGVWGTGYSARHAGIAGVWEGTGERVALGGKNRFADVFEGSEDANILFLTDDEQGDALFADDIYTAAPGKSDEVRVVNIKEIRAGAGDDIVDMTSDRFVSTGGVMTIFGGEGNDTIWANRGSNTLFGDGGNDRIVGGCDADTIIGGAGDDSLHGGGGDDLFVFGKKWGNDTVTQLAGGKVTLWFAEGDETNWNAEEMSFTYSGNTVKVSGVSADDVTLKFGDDGSDLYTTLCSAGAFSGSASQKVSTSNKKYSIETNEIIEDTILSDSTVYVESGEAASNVTLENGGCLYLISGSAFDTYISGGELDVTNGGYASGVTIDERGDLIVDYGSAEDIVVNEGGYVSVGNWGYTAIVSNTTLSGYNVSMFISSDGSTIETYVYDGAQVYVYDSGFAQDTFLEGGSMYISSGGTASEVQIQKDAGVIVSSGGSLASATLNCDGYLNIESGGTISDTVVNGSAHLTISEGAKANKTTLNDGSLTVSSGGSANGVTVSNGGYLYVESGGTALKVDWTPCDGIVSSAAGASVTYASALTGVYMGSNGSLVSHANDMNYVSRFDLMYIMSNGVAEQIDVYWADVYVSKGGTISYSEIREGGSVFVESGGYASNMSIYDISGFMQIANGASGSDIYVSYGILQIDSDAYVTDVYENGGYVHIADGADVKFASNTITGIGIGDYRYSYSSTTVHKNTVLEDATVHKSGLLEIFEGGSATGIVENGGYVYVEEGAIVDFAENTFGNSALKNSATVHKNTVAENLDVQGHGYLYIYDGGVATGIKENGGFVYAEDGANVVFEVNTITGYINKDASLHTNTVAQDVTVSGGRLHVFRGGLANNVTVSGGHYYNEYYIGTYRDGRLYIYSGGNAENVTLHRGGYLYISSGGSAENVTVNSNGSMYISSGGTATGIIENGGWVEVAEGANVTFQKNTFRDMTFEDTEVTLHSGTTAQDITVSAAGTLHVFRGGVANSVNLRGGNYNGEPRTGQLLVYSGGSADTITVDRYGFLTVSSSGIAKDATVYTGGSMYISSEGTATGIIENGGWVEVAEGANVTFTKNTFSNLTIYEDASLHSGTTAESVNVYGGKLHVFSGGVACNISVRYGEIQIDAGGSADTVELDFGGNLTIMNEGIAQNAKVNEGGTIYISSGGSATEIIENGGWVEVEEGATVVFASNTIAHYSIDNSMTVHANTIVINTKIRGTDTEIKIFSGGIASSNTVEQGVLNVCGGSAKDTMITGSYYYDSKSQCYTACDGLMILSSDGIASNTTIAGGYSRINGRDINFRGHFHISSGGIADNNTVGYRGYMYISEGGIANSTTISNGSMHISSGGTANYTTVNFGGYMHIDGTANSTTVNSSGTMYINSGGTANYTTVNSSGTMNINSGGTANSTTINSRGTMYINGGGTANSTTVNLAGSMFIRSGGTANSTTVSAGSMNINSGGTANSTTVSSGHMSIGSGGTANSTTVSGGYMLIYAGGTATQIIENGGYVEVAEGANVTFASNTFKNVTVASRHATVHSNTCAENTTINTLGSLTIFEGGTAKSTTVSGGWLYISSGGTANSTTVSAGTISIGNGGTANSTTISGGYMYISSGGIANSTTISGGSMNISSGGIANSTTLNGTMIIRSGGTANSTTLNSDGHMSIDSGGTATQIIENGGCVEFAAGAEVTFASNTFKNVTVSGRHATVHSNTCAENTTINKGGVLRVSEGGIANSTTINSSGIMYINSGGIASSTMVSGGRVYISSGGKANSTTIDAAGSIWLEGGVANDTMVNNYGAHMYVCIGGIANRTTVSNGSMFISSGGIASSTMIIGGGARMYISSGGKADNTTVNSRSNLYVSAGGTATQIVENGGAVTVEEGAEVTFAANTFKNLTVSGGGGVTVHSNTIAENTTIGRDCYMKIFEGGIANSTTIISSGYIYVSGGIANNTTVSGGSMFISSGGTANCTTVSGGSMYVNGGTANSTTINSRGVLYISKGGVASNTTLASGGSMYISAGAVADGVSFGSGAYISLVGTMRNAELLAGQRAVMSGTGKVENMTVYENAFLTTSNTEISGLMVEELGAVYVSGGMISDSEVENLGILQYCSGTVASNTVVRSGGHCYIGSGAFHQGEFNIEEGATVIAFTGSLLDFTLVGRAADDEALVTNLSAISGNISYSITVSTDQASGLYTLADNVETFTQDVDLYFGDLLVEGFNVGETIETEFVSFELILENNTLFLEVDSDLPVAASFSSFQSPPLDLAGTPPELLADGLAGNEQTYGLLA